MFIQKDAVLEIADSRKGSYIGVAIRDFDTEDEWYPIVVHQEEPVIGMNRDWYKGDEIPARKGLSQIVNVGTEDKPHA